MTAEIATRDHLRNSVLVVPDPELNTLLVDHLSTSPWTVEYVGSNDAALEMLKLKAFDLVITAEASSAKEDIELLRTMRRVRPHTRMIILTNESTTQEVIAALRQRAFSYFSRPYSLESLIHMVRIAMEQPCWDDGIEVVSATTAWIRLLVRCEQTTADRMLQYFSELVELPEEEVYNVAYAFREMLLNAMRHGGNFDPTQYVEVSYLRAQRAVACRVKDPGQGFSFAELYHAAVSNPTGDPIRHMLAREAAGMPPGGYGILLTRQLVDELLYNEQGNEVVMVKYLDLGDHKEVH